MIGFLAQASELMLKSMPHLSVESSNCQIGFDGLGYRLALSGLTRLSAQSRLMPADIWMLTSLCLWPDRSQSLLDDGDSLRQL